MGQFSDIDQVYQKETRKANMLYEFVILYHNYIYAQHTYEAENCNMMEIHTLTYIDDSPGITVTQLSKSGTKQKRHLPDGEKADGSWICGKALYRV